MDRVKYTKYVCTLGITNVEAFISLDPVVLGSLFRVINVSLNIEILGGQKRFPLSIVVEC